MNESLSYPLLPPTEVERVRKMEMFLYEIYPDHYRAFVTKQTRTPEALKFVREWRRSLGDYSQL